MKQVLSPVLVILLLAGVVGTQLDEQYAAAESAAAWNAESLTIEGDLGADHA